MRSTRRGTRRISAARGALLVGAAVTMVVPASLAGAAQRAPGTGKPPAGSGINTAAAYDNPDCVRDDGPYGSLPWVPTEPAPVCLPQWEGGDNGGATHDGVTADSVKVVVLLPNDEQTAALPRGGVPTNYATGQSGTVRDAVADAHAAHQHAWGGKYSYGRDVELEFVVSSGSDEAAQRADAVTVKAMEPFIVMDAVGTSVNVFNTEIAAAKIPNFSLNATVEETLEQAPYRWGQTDPVAGTLNAAEFIGKQLADRKAEHAGDEAMQGEKRVFGMVVADIIEVEPFLEELAKYDIEIAPRATITYPGTTATLGDPAVAQEHAPIAITRLKEEGVTSVILLADGGMTGAMTEQATMQEYRPEWIYAGAYNIDLPLLARGYDQDQWAHAFGISNVAPGSPDTNTAPNVIQWYWGEGQGTFGVSYTNAMNWLWLGITQAGPDLTPKTLKQGFFAVPAQGGSASDDPALAVQGTRSGYGRVNGLPYPEYMRGNKDFTATWWDPVTEGPPMLGFPAGTGTLWYIDGAKRFYAGAWPTKRMALFDESGGAIRQFDTLVADEVPPCTGCPSETGQGTPSNAGA